MSVEKLEDSTVDDLERQIAAMEAGEGSIKPEGVGKSGKVLSDSHDYGDYEAEVEDGLEPCFEDSSKAASGSKDANKAEIHPAIAHIEEAEEDELMAEEDVYHTKEQILSITCLEYEIRTFIDPILDGHLGGENFRDMLDTQKDDFQLLIDNVTSRIDEQKLSPEKYMTSVEQGRTLQNELLAQAKTKKTSKVTIARIKKRLELMEDEIQQIKAEATEKKDTRTPPPVQNKAPARQLSNISTAKSQTIRETEGADFMSHFSKDTFESDKYMVSIKIDSPDLNLFKASDDDLDKLSKRFNQYVYFVQYCHAYRVPGFEEVHLIAKQVKPLFKSPTPITQDQYEAAMDSMEPLVPDLIVGMTPAERQAKVEEDLRQAIASFELMKALGCSKEEALSTTETIKYLKKIKDIPLIRPPLITSTELSKAAPNQTNKNIPENTLRLTIVKLTGAGADRRFQVRYSLDYNGTRSSGSSPAVNACNIE